jgi:hypothetical protein
MGGSPGDPLGRCQALLSGEMLPRPEPNRAALCQAQDLLRKAAARSFDAVASAIGRLLDSFTSRECANYFVNLGYSGLKIIPL